MDSRRVEQLFQNNQEINTIENRREWPFLGLLTLIDFEYPKFTDEESLDDFRVMWRA